jgi:hypothetical protein
MLAQRCRGGSGLAEAAIAEHGLELVRGLREQQASDEAASPRVDVKRR